MGSPDAKKSDAVKRALLRTDASPAIGGGHVARCMTFADALAQDGWRSTFAVRPGTLETVPALRRSGHDIIELTGSGDAAEISRGLSGPADLLVVDHYGLDARFERACRPWAKRILVIDDLANRPHDCDCLVDQREGSSPADYAALVPAGARVLAGAKYALLAKGYAKRRVEAMARRRSGDAQRILVSFGLVDAGDATSMTLSVLGRIRERRLAVDVVMGASAPHLERVKELAAVSLHQVTVHVATDDMARLMTLADLAIGAGGTTSWERCCLGLPSVVVAVADNQLPNAAVLERRGAAVCIGVLDEGTPGRLEIALDELLIAPERVRSMAAAAAALCDGRGASRVRIDAGPPVNAADGRPVHLRPALATDGDVMLDWQSAPGAREFSGDKRPPDPRQHSEWFAAKLQDVDCLFNVIMHDAAPAGVLRYDRTPDGAWVVSILITGEKQRLGLASAALELGGRLLAGEALRAKVHPANVASARLFERAGFKRTGPDEFMREGHEVYA